MFSAQVISEFKSTILRYLLNRMPLEVNPAKGIVFQY